MCLVMSTRSKRSAAAASAAETPAKLPKLSSSHVANASLTNGTPKSRSSSKGESALGSVVGGG